MDYAQLALMAKLASEAYDDGTPVSQRLPSGWQLYPLTPKVDAEGYSSTSEGGDFYVARNPATHQLALVIRGADSPDDVPSELLLGLGLISQAASPFQEVVDAAKMVASSLGDQLILTGHSLGGAIAEYLFDHNRGGVVPILGAGFGSPGISISTLSNSDPNFVHVYRTADDIAKIYSGGHVGIGLSIYDDDVSSGYGGEAHSVDRYAAQLQAVSASELIASPRLAAEAVFATSQSVHFLHQGVGNVLTGDTLSTYSLTMGGAQADVLDGSAATRGFWLDGRGGNDAITGGAGADRLAGGDGADTVNGGSGADVLFGGQGADVMNGNAGADVMSGGDGGDVVLGGKDNDQLSGDAGDDLVRGNLGDDLVQGGAGNDTCYGDEGADTIRGGQGDDQLVGGDGADWLSGDRGSDTLTGGSGADIFHTSSGAGADRVTDFSAAEGDRVQLDPGTTYTVQQVGADTVLDMGNGDQMILVGVQLSSLPNGWIFAA